MPWPAAAPINFSATGDNVIVAGVPDQRVKVYSLFFVVSADTMVTIKDGAGIVLAGPMAMKANGSVVLDYREEAGEPIPWFTTSPGNAFIINQSGVAQVGGKLDYIQGTYPS